MFSSVLFFVVATLVVGSQQMPQQVPLAAAAGSHQTNTQGAIKPQATPYNKPPTYRAGVQAASSHQASVAAGNSKTGPSVVLSSGVASRDQRPIVKPAEAPKPVVNAAAHIEATSNKKVREAHEELKNHEASHHESHNVGAHQASTYQATSHQSGSHQVSPPVAAVQKIASTTAKVEEHNEKNQKPADTKVTTNEHHVKTRDVNQELYIVASPIDDPTLLAFDSESSLRDRRIKVLPAFLG